MFAYKLDHYRVYKSNIGGALILVQGTKKRSSSPQIQTYKSTYLHNSFGLWIHSGYVEPTSHPQSKNVQKYKRKKG